jgi:hypothetical protein
LAPLIWKIQVPARLHIFLWLLANSKVLTRDNLARRRHVEDKACLFCNEADSTDHIFVLCGKSAMGKGVGFLALRIWQHGG